MEFSEAAGVGVVDLGGEELQHPPCCLWGGREKGSGLRWLIIPLAIIVLGRDTRLPLSGFNHPSDPKYKCLHGPPH